MIIGFVAARSDIQPLTSVIAQSQEQQEQTVSADVTASTTESKAWSRTKPYPEQEVYYPGTEELKPDEMRVIACSSGMPMPRAKQAAGCFLIELGNGDKLTFGLGTGAFTTLDAPGIPLDYLTNVFITHQHVDHMGDLPTMWI